MQSVKSLEIILNFLHIKSKGVFSLLQNKFCEKIMTKDWRYQVEKRIVLLKRVIPGNKCNALFIMEGGNKKTPFYYDEVLNWRPSDKWFHIQ